MALQADGGPGTYSIVAADPETDAVGVAVQSRYFAVGPVVPWVQPGVGAIATQASANIYYGCDGIDMLVNGISPDAIVAALTSRDEECETRQLAVVNAWGETAVHTGSECVPWAGHLVGAGFSCQGNLLFGPEVVAELAAAFEAAEGPLAERLLTGLEAAEAAGGDVRGSQSAAILVHEWDGEGTPPPRGSVDLRVDDHPRPVAELRRLYHVQKSYQLVFQARSIEDDDEAVEQLVAEAMALNGEDDLVLAIADEHAYGHGDREQACQYLRRAIRNNEKAVCYLTLFGAEELYDDEFRLTVLR